MKTRFFSNYFDGHRESFVERQMNCEKRKVNAMSFLNLCHATLLFCFVFPLDLWVFKLAFVNTWYKIIHPRDAVLTNVLTSQISHHCLWTHELQNDKNWGQNCMSLSFWSKTCRLNCCFVSNSVRFRRNFSNNSNL